MTAAQISKIGWPNARKKAAPIQDGFSALLFEIAGTLRMR